MNKRRLKKAFSRISRLPLNKYLLFYLVNKARNFWYRLIRSNRVAYPSTIMLELTNYCNLACTTCPREYDYGKAMDKGSMQLKYAMKIIDELWPYLDSIGLTGMGETFMYKSIHEIVDYIKAKNSGIIISLSTNAQLPGFIKNASKLAGKVDTIQVSVDGLDSVYEMIRKKASFGVLDKNLRSLSDICKHTKTDVMLNMVVTRENYRQMPNLLRYCNETGIRYMDFTMFNLAAVTAIESNYYQFYSSPEFLSVIVELEKETAKAPHVTVTKNFRPLDGFKHCPFPWTHFYVSWNGFIVPCCAKPFPKEMHFGNVFENSMMRILNNNEYLKFRQLWHENRTPGFCHKCHFVKPN